MSSLYILIPLAVLFIIIAVGVFFWAVDSGQFEDLEGPAHSILFDEPSSKKNSNGEEATQTKVHQKNSHKGDKS